MTEQLEKIPTSPSKRVFDVLASMLLIALLFPVMIFLLLGILVEYLLSSSARGPLLYHETRISQGVPFTLYKVRTFKLTSLATAHSNGIINTKELERDWRTMTVMGLVLRQIYLDEYPQLFLVLLGKMSLVGPRPVNPAEYQRGLAGGIRAKALLRAGITGRFQTHKAGKYGLNQERVDMEYAEFCRNHPGWKIVLHDCRILSETVVTIFRAEGV
ncbi:MAG: hypothetical protein A3C06_04620 [Candidatus Taylorbacteria bacterium RIFCSPHIGHO2_02_FULL_46_13]|uniref:Bacterial sugar transferase domain-containing protein n=1 Tax=Candidatus Taylorbacteria bacterium RIFCSPHIGHO2_02_FULL_46_13 TaxID=1802312 RepID=A0A1G2MR73_9BACT|nr:MAG: hypothetical protein A3C06_04620 [Candidatus Taylorbacteria bacterium RIFCSPHIGHO2_02_FULL_46_13]